MSDSRYKWYVLDILIFIILNIIFLKIALPKETLFRLFEPFNFLIFGLGVYRLADVITYEDVTAFIRAPFKDKVRRDDKVVEEISTVGFRGFAGILVSCPSCAGVWVACISFYSYLFFPAATSAILLVFAFTGMERFYSKIYNVLEAKEGKK